MRLSLNSALDSRALASRYPERRRIQIREFLSADSADAVHSDLRALPWGMAFNDGSRVMQLDSDALKTLQPEEAARIMAGIRDRARTEYQFLYSFYPILTAYFSPLAPRGGIFDFYELMNSPAVLDLVRDVTGLPDIGWADGQATWFKPGHFLKAHTDEERSEGRLAAYVMNLSPTWEIDWGGFLQFFDRDGNIDQAFKPEFNTLNIFTIPQLHSVSMVSTYVTAHRLAVTGWFRSGSPPGPIG